MYKKITYMVIGAVAGIILIGLVFAINKGGTVNAADERTLQPTTPITELPDKSDIEILAKLLWGEARGVESKTEKAAVVWCVLNRVDAKEYPDTIAEVITQSRQFVGYNEDYPATTEHMEIAEDVLNRWYSEKVCTFGVGRVLPREYIFFTGDGKRNHFTNEWKGGTTWDWSLPSPYEN